MALTSVQKGNIIESQVANILMLVSDGELTPSLPIVDDYGVDIILGIKGTFNTIAIQVKSRFVTNSRFKNRLDFQVQKAGFRHDQKLFVVCVYFDQIAGEIDTMWLVPSKNVYESAVSLEKYFRIAASRSESSSDQWSSYKVSPKELVEKLSAHLKKLSN